MKAFSSVLKELNRGAADAALSELLQDVVKEVVRSGKSASLNVILKIVNNGDTVKITPEYKAVMPKPEHAFNIFYPDEDGNITREAPGQMSLQELRDAASEPLRKDLE